MTETNVFQNEILATDGTMVQTPARVGGDGIEHPVYNAFQWDETYVLGAVAGSDPVEPLADQGMIPSVLPRSGKLTIEAAFRTFLVRLSKRRFQLKAGQRYILKAVFNLNLTLISGDTTSLRWRAVFDKDNDSTWETHTNWNSAAAWNRNQVTFLTVIHSNVAQSVGIGIEWNGLWPNYDGNNPDGGVQIVSIELLETTDKDYGKGGVIWTFPLGETPSDGNGNGDPTPDPDPEPTPGEGVDDESWKEMAFRLLEVVEEHARTIAELAKED